MLAIGNYFPLKKKEKKVSCFTEIFRRFNNLIFNFSVVYNLVNSLSFTFFFLSFVLLVLQFCFGSFSFYFIFSSYLKPATQLLILAVTLTDTAIVTFQ